MEEQTLTSTETKTPTITWTGTSGREYTYRIYRIGTSFKDEPGNYMFLKETKPHRYRSVYVGETGSLDDRLSNPEAHHKRLCTKREGATHICVHINSKGEKARKAEEADLISALNPPCNG